MCFLINDIIKGLTLILILSLSVGSYSQAPMSMLDDNFAIGVSDELKFEMFVDSIEIYLYRDFDFTLALEDKCEQLIQNGIQLNDSILLNYAIQKSYINYSQDNVVEAYNDLIDSEHLLDSDIVSIDQVVNHRYLKGYMLMSLGDLEEAQNTYYAAIDEGLAIGDTSIIISSMFSLGQLFNESNDSEESLKCFEKIINYSRNNRVSSTTMILTQEESAEVYRKLGLYNKAIEALKKGDRISQLNKMDVLRFEIMLAQGNIFIEQNNLNAADSISLVLQSDDIKGIDEINITNLNLFRADLFVARKNYSEAMRIYNSVLSETDSTNVDRLIDVNYKAQNVLLNMNDYKSAYHYLYKYNEAKERKDNNVKRQKTEYLKSKYNFDKKELENAILSEKVIKSNSERKTVYFYFILSCLMFIFLAAAFYQKRRYSQKLEGDVESRTNSLKVSNDRLNESVKELNEFNRILSHDLKEPLRGVIGFTQLAIRDIDDKAKVNEHLSYVNKSGTQLSALIDDVIEYRNIDYIDLRVKDEIEVQPIFNSLVSEIQSNFPQREISLKINKNVIIDCHKEAMKIVFKRLIENSIKYNENTKLILDVNYTLIDDNHVFEIKDNGIGIPQQYQDHVFGMFQRLHNRETYSGSGLGLNIVYKTLKKINGNISIVSSEVGLGTTFRVSIPV